MNRQDKPNTEKICKCRKNNTCPLSMKCLSMNIVYKATVKNSNMIYVCTTCTDFKARLANHTYSFKTPEKRNSASLDQYVWENQLNPTTSIGRKLLRQILLTDLIISKLSSDLGDFPRIIEIALFFLFFFVSLLKLPCAFGSTTTCRYDIFWHRIQGCQIWPEIRPDYHKI